MEWLQVKDNVTAAPKLEPLKDPKGACALLAINDDVAEDVEMEPTDSLLRDWYEARWGSIQAWWERSE